MKKYIVFAGVNGVGKSTLYQTWESLQNMPRVNTDEIVREFGDWRNTSDLMKAGKIAVSKMEQYLREDRTFNQETTLCGKAILRTIKKAKEKGYFIELHYVGVEEVGIVKNRVKERVKRGGHGIPESDIERRYIETFTNLKMILPICDLAVFYDNTKQFHRFAIFKNGEPIRIAHQVPRWFEDKVR